jgi:outer membrane protein assembly factor BamB
VSALAGRARGRRAPLGRCARGLVLGAATALTAAAAARPAVAQTIDPARVHRVRVAPDAVRGLRGDADRAGDAPHGLPARPAVAWRRALGGPIETPPVVSADGRTAVVVGGVGEVHLLSPAGDELGSPALGAPAAEVAPAFLADGTLVVATTTGHVAFVARDLTVRRRVAVPVRAVDLQPLAPTPSGGVVVAGGRTIVELDADGRVVASATTDDVLTGPVTVARAADGGHQIIAPTTALLVLRAPFAPRRFARIDRAPGGVVVAPDGALWASAADAIVRLEPRPGALPWRATAASGIVPSSRPPALAPDGSVAFVADDGSLVVMSAAGEVRHRVALDRAAAPAPAGPAGASRPIVRDDGPPVLVDGEGRVAFARPSGRAGIVGPTGLVALASERICASPIGIAAASTRTFVVACGEGVVVAIGDAGEAPRAEGGASGGGLTAR